MKGIILNIFEKYIIEKHNNSYLEHILQSSNLTSDGIFISAETYPDEDLVSLITHYCKLNDLNINHFQKTLGEYTLKQFSLRYPAFFEHYNHPIEFLKSLNSTIHVEVKKLYHEAQTPNINIEEFKDGNLTITYKSKRQMTDFMEGLLLGAINHYGYKIKLIEKFNSKENEFRFIYKVENKDEK